MSILSPFGGKKPNIAEKETEIEDSLLRTGWADPISKEEAEARHRHAELAQKLGVVAVYTGESLRDFLREEAIQIYNRRKVEGYLTKKGEWKWYALREIDQPTVSSAGDSMKWPLYRNLIPWEVLTTVEKITAKFPNAQFLVAALKEDPDPFLGVHIPEDQESFYIIERWDEPGYRER